VLAHRKAVSDFNGEFPAIAHKKAQDGQRPGLFHSIHKKPTLLPGGHVGQCVLRQLRRLFVDLCLLQFYAGQILGRENG
jgi:hypothetical protein